MRILIFYAGGDRGGAKPHILTVARELSKDNSLRLLCFRRGETADDAAAMGIDVRIISEKEGFFAARRFALEQVGDFRPDLIHCHGSKANLLGVLMKQKTGIPVISTVHSDPELDYMGAPIRNISFGNANRWALRRMDYYITVASRLRDILISRNFDPQRIFTVFNAIEFDDLSYDDIRRKIAGISGREKPAGESVCVCDADGAAGRAAACDTGDTLTVGIAARLNPVKDMQTLLKAFALARKTDSRLRLSIAGTGEEELRLKKLADELGISPFVRFEGWVSDMRSYFRRIDINVLCSLSETFPYSLLEGAAQFVPAAASNVGGIPLLIKDGETGLLFEPGDHEALAGHILRLAADEALRRSLAVKLHDKAKSEYSVERMRRDQQDIYETVLRRSRKKGRRGAVLCGAYGKGNAGDEAILKAIISSLRGIDEDMPIYVMSRKPMETRLQNHVNSFFIFDIFKLHRALRKTKLFISGGGTLIQDVTSTRSLLFYLYAIRAAARAGSKIEMYGCGIGPISKAGNRRKTARVLNELVDVISLRDSVSVELLKEMGVIRPEIVLAADPTVNLPSVDGETVRQSFLSIGAEPDERKIIFCLRAWDKFNDYSPVTEAAEYAYSELGLTPVFLPMEYPRDLAIAREIAGRLKCRHIVSLRRHSIEELRGMLASAELVVGMRLHSLVFAASGGAPVLGISYDLKVSSFIKDSGAKRLIELEELSAEKLKENIRAAIQDGRAMGEETKRRLQLLERQNADIAARLLGE